MSVTVPMPAAQLDHLKTLWHELQHTRPTSDRYKQLVQLIRAEASAYLAPTVMNHQPQPTKA